MEIINKFTNLFTTKEADMKFEPPNVEMYNPEYEYDGGSVVAGRQGIGNGPGGELR